MLDPKDGGYKSRKFWFAMWATFLIFTGAWIGSKVPTFMPMYDTMVGGIVGVVAAFLTGNIASKWVIGKTAKKKPEAEETDEEK